MSKPLVRAVYIDVTKTGGDFITPATGVRVPLSDLETTTTYSLMTTDPNAGVNDIDTRVTVTLLDRAGYTLANSPDHSADVLVTDGTDGLSVINVMATATSVAEGADVQFTFTANPQLANNLDVMITLTETGKQFPSVSC